MKPIFNIQEIDTEVQNSSLMKSIKAVRYIRDGFMNYAQMLSEIDNEWITSYRKLDMEWGVNYNDEKLIAAEFIKTQKRKPYNVNRFAITFKSQQELVDFVKKYN